MIRKDPRFHHLYPMNLKDEGRWCDYRSESGTSFTVLDIGVEIQIDFVADVDHCEIEILHNVT